MQHFGAQVTWRLAFEVPAEGGGVAATAGGEAVAGVGGGVATVGGGVATVGGGVATAGGVAATGGGVPEHTRPASVLIHSVSYKSTAASQDPVAGKNA